MGLITFSFLLDAVIFALTVSYGLYKYFTWDFGYWKKRNVPFVPPTPIIGNFGDVLATKNNIGGFLGDLYAKMPGTDYFGIWVFGTPHLVLRSPEVIKNILVKDFNYFQDRTVTSDTRADPVVSNIIFMMKNPKWKTMRSKLTPIFTTGKIKNMVPLMNSAAAEMIDYLNKHDNIGVDVKEITAKYSTDVITSCGFGVNAESFKHPDAAFRAIGRKMFDFKLSNAIRGVSYFFAPAIVKFFKLTFFEGGVNEFCRDAFWQAIKERETAGVKRNDVIDIIIQLLKTNQIVGDEAVAQAVQFFAAGFETTASTISYTLYEMAVNSNYQTRLRKEIKEVMQEHKELTYESIKDLKYLDQVVKETLRKYPVLPFLDRRCVEDYTMPDGKLVIEKETPVYVPVLGVHYDEDYYPTPHVYDPERFNEENSSKILPYTYLPFGTGPHNCIGERFGLIASKMGICQILANFYVECHETTPIPIVYDPKSFILQPIGGLPLNILPLNGKVSIAG